MQVCVGKGFESLMSQNKRNCLSIEIFISLINSQLFGFHDTHFWIQGKFLDCEFTETPMAK